MTVVAFGLRLARQVGLSRRIAGDGVWVACGQIVSAIALLFSIRMLTELLSPEEFGRLTLLVGLSALALGLSATPRFQAVMRYYPDCGREGRIGVLRRTGIQLITPLVVIAVAILASGWLVAGPLLGEAWPTGLLVAALLIIDCLRSFELSLLNAARRQRPVAVIQAADAWSRPLMATAAVLAFGSCAASALAGYVTGSAIIVLAIRAFLTLEGTSERETAKKASNHIYDMELKAAMRRYALPLAPLALFGWLNGMGDRYVITGLLSLHEAGLYAAAHSLASRPFLMLGGVMELTMRPILQNAVAAGDAVLIARTKTAWLLSIVAGAAFGVIGFVGLSEWVGHLLLAEQYRSAAVLMPWIAFGFALFNIATVYTRFCYAFDDTRAVLSISIYGWLLGAPLMVGAIYFVGLQGAALSVPAVFSVQLLFSTIKARRVEHRWKLRNPSA